MTFANLPHSFAITYFAAHGSPEYFSQVNRLFKLTAVMCGAGNTQIKLAAKALFGTSSTNIQAPNLCIELG